MSLKPTWRKKLVDFCKRYGIEDYLEPHLAAFIECEIKDGKPRTPEWVEEFDRHWCGDWCAERIHDPENGSKESIKNFINDKINEVVTKINIATYYGMEHILKVETYKVNTDNDK